ncbi:peptide ABC transporter substrate-binding protein [Microbacterium faecale]|uniref:Peptide ABC transporter substrate-binding protein n=1 Tax=Microbacterium faecale TaxID=1804630 RepID=A0A916Y4Q8_9MICO|nr:ABC transporter substrate-binding protein [Microbacterium faecale]GGD29612.1 peptide ABC transporter substrate-binding protein [Microbacterium faecale]
MRVTRLITIAGATAAALVLASCSAGGSGTSGSGDGSPTKLTVGSLQEPTSWDPAQANEGHLAPIYQALYDPLVKREPDGTLSPMLATEWETSEDGLTLTFTLRTDVTFNDGTPFNAEAVKINLEHFMQANGPMAGNYSTVDSVEVVDDETVVLHLSEPDPELIYSLSNAGGYMASPASIEDGTIGDEPVGSGPYLLDQANSVVGSNISYERNPDYWGEELPYDEVEFKILTDETARLNALTSGQIDVASLNRAASAVQADSADLNTEESFSVNWGGLLFFDRSGELQPEFEDVRVREALAIAIDSEALVDVGWEGRGSVTTQVWGSDTGAYDDSLNDAYAYDPERARELLEEAGASDLAVTMPLSPVFEPVIYDAIIQNWQDIGVTVERQQWGPGEAIPSMQQGEVPVAFMTLAQRSDWGTVKFLIAEDAPWNALESTDPELQELMDGYQAASDEDRPGIAREMNEWIVDNFWFAPIMHPDTFIYWNDDVDVEVQVQQAVPSIYNFTPSGS